ncbi:hypothetical protein SAMN05421749_10533 [Acinetobacter marinus]|uniref:Lipoprotein n=1 Tax=Acinetobacter marinus TaxID=281375 RepID=A0A1G6LDW8_9GAMM|nr:hypothetical protein SAMN05421749_10533 [Acinetobacter marinus]
MFKVQRMCQGLALAVTAAVTFSGCSHVIKSGANVALRFSENHIVPPILAMDDADMACASGNALTPAIMATKDMGADPTKMAVLLYTSAGMCAESEALESELRYLRAAKAGNVAEAQDARIEQKRWSAIAAKRQYTGYQLFAERWENKYKFRLGDSCPSMKKDIDKTVYLLGMLSGLQAVTNDINSGGEVEVPKDIAAIVERGMACLDNTQFWGAPNATRAVIWQLLPGAEEGKPDPQQTLRDSMAIGERTGVRLPHALYAVAAQASGDPARIREALRAYGNSLGEDKAVNPDYRLVNTMSGLMVRAVADRYWTENTGVRMADGGYTTFWDEQPDDGLGDLGNDLFDAMGADASTDAVATTEVTDNTDTVSDAVADASVSDEAQPIESQPVEADSEEVSEAAEAVKQAADEVESTTPAGE